MTMTRVDDKLLVEGNDLVLVALLASAGFIVAIEAGEELPPGAAKTVLELSSAAADWVVAKGGYG